MTCPICKCETYLTVCPNCGGNANHYRLMQTQKSPGVVRLPPRLGVFIEDDQLIAARESSGAWMRADDVIAALRAAGVAHV